MVTVVTGVGRPSTGALGGALPEVALADCLSAGGGGSQVGIRRRLSASDVTECAGGDGVVDDEGD